MSKFDPAAALAAVKAGKLVPPSAPVTPADLRDCSDPRCDQGFITIEEAQPGVAALTRPCPACAARNAKKASRATLKAAGLTETIYDRTWDSLDLSHESWQLALGFAQEIDALIKDRTGLIFVGDYGRGKTQAATLTLAEAAAAGYHVERVKWGAFVRRVRSTYNRESKLQEDDLIRALVAPDLLLLDDVGAADKHTEHNERLLTAVIDERYDQGRPIILTTNLGRAELEEHLGGRAFDRLWNNSETILFTGPNYRELSERPRTRTLGREIRDRVRQQMTGQAAD